MKKHTQIYIKAFNYVLDDFIPSEISGNKGVDIHHIIGRGKKGEDRIENLMCLTRQEHIDYGDKKEHMKSLLMLHRNIMKINNVPFDSNWFNEKINFYD
jgi:hypothetical protein